MSKKVGTVIGDTIHWRTSDNIKTYIKIEFGEEATKYLKEMNIDVCKLLQDELNKEFPELKPKTQIMKNDPGFAWKELFMDNSLSEKDFIASIENQLTQYKIDD